MDIRTAPTRTVSPYARLSDGSKTDQAVWLTLGLCLVAALGYARFAGTVVRLALADDRFSHLLVIAPIAAGLIFFDRQRIFSQRSYALTHAMWISAALASAALLTGSILSPENLFLATLVLVVSWIAIFGLLHGPQATISAAFPLALLLLMLPPPLSWMDAFADTLKRGSTEVTQFLFRVVQMPFLRQGFQFSLPGIDIEVAQECSGLRSTLALTLAGLIAGQLLLRTFLGKLALTLVTIPVSIFRNAIRIVSLSWLSVFVDRSYLFGNLHHHGGPLFALVGVFVLIPILFWIRRLEKTTRAQG